MMHEMNNLFPGDDLPDELTQLAEQLGNEADLMAGMYPARAPQFVPTVDMSTVEISSERRTAAPGVPSASADRLLSPMPVWMRWSAAAAVLVCAVWGSLSTQDQTPVYDFGTPRGHVVDIVPRASRPTPVSAEPLPMSRDLYENLTAPAREALLDMWEAESAPQASLSI
jgi:hypothetical protein